MSEPRPKLSPEEAQARLDGWNNVFTLLGVKGRDKRLGGSFAAEPLSHEELLNLWRGDDIAARIVETIPREMLREGHTLTIHDEDADRVAEITKGIAAAQKKLKVRDLFYQALCFERAFGGGAILLGADDGEQDLTKPINEGRLKAIRWLSVFNRREVYAERYYTNVAAENYGEPELWRIQPEFGVSSPLVVHETRLLLFKGIQISRRQTYTNLGWGDPVLLRVYDALRDFAQAFAGTAALLQDFSQAVFQIKDLSELISTNQDDVLKERFKIIDLCRSMLRAVVLDKDETFTRQTTPVAGLGELLDKFSLRVAASAEMPVSLMMGQAPAGLNATGASDIRFFYDGISAKQENKLKPNEERLTRLLFLCKEGPTNGKEPASWDIEYKPLWQSTAQESADLRYKQAQTDDLYLKNGVLTKDEVANSRFGGHGYRTETVLDVEARQKKAAEPAPVPAPVPTPQPVPPPGAPS